MVEVTQMFLECSGAQVAVVDSTDTTIEELLAAPDSPDRTLDLAEEQRKDRYLRSLHS